MLKFAHKIQSKTCFLFSLFLLTSCQPNSIILEPNICFIPPASLVERLPSAFEELSFQERKEDWGKEMVIAETFAREMDLYRAITGFKRAKILIPHDLIERRLQIDYNIAYCYYLGGKYAEVIEIFERGELHKIPRSFPAFNELLIMLYDCYQQGGHEERTNLILKNIENNSPESAQDLILSTALIEGEIEVCTNLTLNNPSYCVVEGFLATYYSQKKSVRKAQYLNAFLPGAGYLYVGQKKTALTSFLLNTLFTTAAYQFFHRGYIAAGIITTSLECGWYFGGINGAGLAVKSYNECLYEEKGKEALIKGGFFPILMFETSF